MGNPPEDTSDENSYAEIDDSRTIPDVPINKGYLTKITAELAFDASNRILIPMNLRRRLNIKSDEQVLDLSDSSPVANVQVTPRRGNFWVMSSASDVL